jgi:DNA-binding beta-propeller fold protein YncE
MRIKRIVLTLCAAMSGLYFTGAGCGVPPSVVNFETIPTRAVALSPDGRTLFVTNTPDSRLEIFDVTSTGLVRRGAVQVGLEPIAVAARSNSEVWVVNHLSDSVSIVDVSANPPFVARTLLVGDEPRDVVFAGPREAPGGPFRRAFVSAARRGQNHPADTFSEQRQGGVGRTDVWVFDALSFGTRLGGSPLTIVQMFGDKAGALEAMPDGARVFVSVFTSGNETSIINAGAVCATPGAPNQSRQTDVNCGPMQARAIQPGGVPAPNVNQVDGTPNPRTGLIVKFDRSTTPGRWLDILGRNWTPLVPFVLPDNDVFTIDALAAVPVQNGVFQHTGTLNEGIAIHPSGRAYLATTEAINTNRFISAPTLGLFPNPNPAPGVARTADPATGKTLNGHLYESRIAILGTDGSVAVRHLNPHINYEIVPSLAGVKERSVSSPRGGVFSADGSTLFVVAMGSNKIVPFATSALDSGQITPDASTHIQLSGVGPTTAVLDAERNRLYVYTRIDNAVAVVDLASRREVARTGLFSPEIAPVIAGRRFFYDATVTSSNGEANCSVCHPAGDKDDLAWDLGAPFMGVSANPNFFVPGSLEQIPGRPPGAPNPRFNPLKGPMTVLTLRGLRDAGPLFWRGDATNPQDPINGGRNFLLNFNVVFPALLGNSGFLDDTSLLNLTSWAITLTPPPNPHRNLDNSLTFNQSIGAELFTNRRTDGLGACIACHRLDPAKGFFGSGGEMTLEGETQEFKVTQLRTTYDKVGMFGVTADPPIGGVRPAQLRGFGTLHDGSLAGPESFIRRAFPQTLNAGEAGLVGDAVLTFPSAYAPIVGQQITLRADSPANVNARIDLMRARALAPFVLRDTNDGVRECDLVVKGVVDGVERGFLMLLDGSYLDDEGGVRSDAALRSLALTSAPLTFTCTYPGSGIRLAFDRNNNGTSDKLERNNPLR